MNLGQLIETHLGLVKHLGFAEDSNDNPGRCFEQVDFEKLRQALQQINQNDTKNPVIDDCGKMFLTLGEKDGKEIRTEHPVVVGFQYFFRLNHIPSKKAQARSELSEFQKIDGSQSLRHDVSTGEAVGGRVNKGGQRIGEMETWALMAYQAYNTLRWLYSEKNICDIFDSTQTGDRRIYSKIKDYLKALDIDLYIRQSKIGMAWINEKQIDEATLLKWANEKNDSIVRSPKSYRRGISNARFRCSECSYCSELEASSNSNASDEASVWELTVWDVLAAYYASEWAHDEFQPYWYFNEFWGEKALLVNKWPGFQCHS